MRRDYQVRDVAPYINWIYFFHAWGFEPRYAEVANLHDCEACRRTWQASFPSEIERNKAKEAAKLFLEARRMLRELDGRMRVQTAFRLCVANSDGNDLLLDDVRLPLLRQQASTSPDGICLCLSDFVRPLGAGVSDKVGVFAASVDDLTEVSSANDDYHLLLIQTLSDRLVEAGVELMHLEVRKSVWGYSPNEDLPVAALHAEAFQGIRPAVGYPSLPDQSINFILDRLLDFSSIGVRLTEHAAMHPHASVSGLMFAHPAARYFSIGSIGEDQLADYAARRGMTIETIRRFLNRNC
ncbi:MAG: 5-methyltetrahydrofolate--homocysteine methyltransferase [Mediterranea massiliensis]|nr:5-methyltetrahydrofolate--homocysteine methyltransferase [Mediterranea massiliensis]